MERTSDQKEPESYFINPQGSMSLKQDMLLSLGLGERPTPIMARDMTSPFFTEAGISGSGGWVRFGSRCAMCVCGAASVCSSAAAGNEMLGPGRGLWEHQVNKRVKALGAMAVGGWGAAAKWLCPTLWSLEQRACALHSSGSLHRRPVTPLMSPASVGSLPSSCLCLSCSISGARFLNSKC